MGMLEDAQAAVQSQRQVARDAELTNQTAQQKFQLQETEAVREYVEAMNRLGIPARTHVLLAEGSLTLRGHRIASSYYYLAGGTANGWFVPDPTIALQGVSQLRAKWNLRRGIHPDFEKDQQGLHSPVIVNPNGLVCLASPTGGHQYVSTGATYEWVEPWRVNRSLSAMGGGGSSPLSALLKSSLVEVVQRRI